MNLQWIIALAVCGVVAIGVWLLLRSKKAGLSRSTIDEPQALEDSTNELRLSELGEPSTDIQPADTASKAERVETEKQPSVPPAHPVRPSGPSFSLRPEARKDAFREGLQKTRGGLFAKLGSLFGAKEINEELLDELEGVLLGADIGVRTVDRWVASLRESLSRGELRSPDVVWQTLRDNAAAVIAREDMGEIAVPHQPTVVLVVGVNGVGKTTTIGKLAHRFKGNGKSVLLAAGDTFRAAAVPQLEVWGRRVGCAVVKGNAGADSASVIFDAIKQADAEKIDIVLADTAGRLHTKTPLMDELKKVHRTAEKALGRPVDHVLQVIDATTGQNASQQVTQFKEALPVSALALTKLDGTAKGGVVLGIVDTHQVPIAYVGLGEKVGDLRAFDRDEFLDALFARG